MKNVGDCHAKFWGNFNFDNIIYYNLIKFYPNSSRKS